VAARLTVMAVTDHDTLAAVPEATALAAAHAIEVVAGIEITAVENGLDVHVLGYFVNPAEAALSAFLVTQRQLRLTRVRAIADRLAALGRPVDIDSRLADAEGQTARAVGRPLVARAMIEAGYVATVRDAFDQWLGHGRPAFVPRTGATPESVIAIIQRAGGLASLAHPGRTGIDGRLAALRDAGLDALEVFHSDHDPSQVERYRRIARGLGCLVTGGSDFHGDPDRAVSPGSTTLPADEWDRLRFTRHAHG
jgi:predicted metal-dependent phosphoesterase TrpH